MGNEGVSAAATGDTTVNGFTGKRTMCASTPTHRTHVCVAWCGPDSVETGVSLLSVQPSGQQNLSTLTSTVNATRMRTATARTSCEYIPGKNFTNRPDACYTFRRPHRDPGRPAGRRRCPGSPWTSAVQAMHSTRAEVRVL